MEVFTEAESAFSVEIVSRRKSLAAAMANESYSCIVASRPEHVTYLTGYTSSTLTNHVRPIISVLTHDERTIVIVPETEADSAKGKIPGAEIRSYSGMSATEDRESFPDGSLQFAPLVIELLSEVLAEVGDGMIGVDGLGAVWPPAPRLVERCRGISNRLRDCTELFWTARLHKSDWELDQMRHVATVLDTAHDLTMERIRPGMTEQEICRCFTQSQVEAGSQLVGPMGVVAGLHQGLFGDPTARVWKSEDLLYLDGTTCVSGYWADFCRTYTSRPLSKAETDGYQRALDGLNAAVEVAKPEMKFGELGLAMARAMKMHPSDVGFGRFGHGIGLWIPEPPSVHPDDPTILDIGMTICIEPAVKHEGLNFVLEAGYVMTKQGFQLFTPPARPEIISI